MSRWPILPLKGYIAEVSNRKGETTAEVLSVTNTNGFVRSVDVFDKQVFSQDTGNYKLVRFNDIAYNPSRINVGSVARCHLLDGGAVSPMYVVLRCHESLLPQYLLYFLKSDVGLKHIIHRCVGAVRFQLRYIDLEQIEIPIPPIEEQERIVRILDEGTQLQLLRAAADRRTADLMSALFHEMFGDLGASENKCKLVRLEEVTIRITDGVHLKPTYTASGIPFISVKDITTGRLKFDDCKFISREDHERFTKRCKPEYLDILYTKVGATYGRPAIIDTDREFSIYVSVCLLKPDKRLIEPQYLNAVLGTAAVKRQADQTIKGIGVPDLHLDQIRNFQIPLPPIVLQRQFVDHCSEIVSLTDGQADSRQRLYDLFQSMLYRAFQGEL
ncbi:MAG: restriction endonuclease subunit S [Methanosarcinales archaeon]|nr:restriction endonuclease subunit S [Deltaproteobacteria bacterium]TRZ88960.1 MAG: restriction endonuclease subunit S [Methanosarcinales archaeon]